MANLYDAGISPYTPAAYSDFDDESMRQYQQMMINAASQWEARQRQMQPVSAALEEYIKRQAAPPPHYGAQGFNTPLAPEAISGAQQMAPNLGLQMPPKQRATPQEAQAIIAAEYAKKYNTPMGAPVQQAPQQYGPVEPPPQLLPGMSTTVTGTRDRKPMQYRPMADLRPSVTQRSAPMTAEDVAMWSKVLPYGTQRDVTQMQTEASLANNVNTNNQKSRTVALKAAVDLVTQANKRAMFDESQKMKLRLALEKAKKGDNYDLLKIANAARDDAKAAEQLLQQAVQGGLATQPPDSPDYQQFMLVKQQAEQKRQIADFAFGMASRQHMGVPESVSPPQSMQQPAFMSKPSDQWTDEELAAARKYAENMK